MYHINIKKISILFHPPLEKVEPKPWTFSDELI